MKQCEEHKRKQIAMNVMAVMVVMGVMEVKEVMKNILADHRMATGDDGIQGDDGLDQALAPEELKLRPPPLYRVVLLNDDYTPMEFVVEVLCKFFHMNLETATAVMLKVHKEGKGVCGVFPKEIAETKAVMVNEYSRESEHPLLCDIEVDDDR